MWAVGLRRQDVISFEVRLYLQLAHEFLAAGDTVIVVGHIAALFPLTNLSGCVFRWVELAGAYWARVPPRMKREHDCDVECEAIGPFARRTRIALSAEAYAQTDFGIHLEKLDEGSGGMTSGPGKFAASRRLHHAPLQSAQSTP